jgi:hypothetical protein
MQLRSGTITKNVINQKGPQLTESKQQYFSTYWPSLEEARNLSIKTDDPELFNWFATSLVERTQDKNNLHTNRLCLLILIESFFRCGLPVLKKYHRIMLIAYVKVESSYLFTGTPIPNEMSQYLMKFNELISQVLLALNQ